MSYTDFWMIVSRSFHMVANFIFIRFNQSPRICYRWSLPISCRYSSPQWSWTLFVSHSTYSHIQIWMEPVWIEWCYECDWLDIPVECPIEGVNNEQNTSSEEQDHRWVLVYLFLSPCPWYHSFQHFSWFHLNTCLSFVSERMEGHWICYGVVWILRYHTR